METSLATAVGQPSNLATTASNSDVEMMQEDMSDDVSLTSVDGGGATLQNGHDVMMTSELPENDIAMETSNLNKAVAKAVQVHSNTSRSDSPSSLSGQIDGVKVITNQPEQVIVS